MEAVKALVDATGDGKIISNDQLVQLLRLIVDQHASVQEPSAKRPCVHVTALAPLVTVHESTESKAPVAVPIPIALLQSPPAAVAAATPVPLREESEESTEQVREKHYKCSYCARSFRKTQSWSNHQKSCKKKVGSHRPLGFGSTEVRAHAPCFCDASLRPSEQAWR